MLLKKLARYSKAGGLFVACVAAAAILITAYQPAQPTDIPMPTAYPEAEAELAAAVLEPAVTAAVARSEMPAAPAPEVKKAAAKAPAPRPAATKTVAATATAAKTAKAPEPVAKATAEPGAKIPAAAASAANSPVQGSSVTTPTGCLERDKQTFRLKNTSGEDAPKARSWKSGFLRKGSATIEVVDAVNRLKLQDHVGELVSVTGALVDREMSARSLQRVASSCD